MMRRECKCKDGGSEEVRGFLRLFSMEFVKKITHHHTRER
jgi:hypothetical protein